MEFGTYGPQSGVMGLSKGGTVKHTFKPLLIFILFSCITVMPVHAAKRALVIGIDDYKHSKIPDLGGCVGDGNAMVKILKDHLGFTDSEIKYLINSQATRAGILNALDKWVVDGTDVGDKILIYYAGHGYFTEDDNGDEKDEKNPMGETLCPHDTDPDLLKDRTKKGNMITDDEIGERLARLKGRQVILIFDSCHSGTATRGGMGKELPVRSLSFAPRKEGSRSLPEIRKKQTSSHTGNVPVHALSEEIDASKSYMTFLAAASPLQEAKELTPYGINHGALTYSIIKAFENAGRNVCLSDIKKFFDEIKEEYGIKNQEPQTEGNPGLAKRPLRGIFGTSFSSDAAYAAENPNPDMTLQLWANEKGKKKFRLYDSVRFHTVSSDDGYLYLFDLIESSDQMYLIYPNQWTPTNHIRKNTEILIPPTAVRGEPVTFEFTAEQKGNEKIIAIVTKTPWQEMNQVIGKNTEPVKVMNKEQKSQILTLLYQKQSGRHLEYDPEDSLSGPNDWVGTVFDLEIY